MPRARCLRCRRPEITCYCSALPTIPTQTRVVILQHSRERDMPIGTARMASLCLPNSELHVGVHWGEHAALAAALSDPARPPILLYPGADAKDVLTDPPRGPVTLVVVDGTWSQAKVVVRDNPILQSLPRYAFAAPAPSQYRIRKEPRAEYVSTIEALMYVLGALEGDPAAMRPLLAPLHAMVDNQLAAQAASPKRFSRQVRKRAKPARPLPPGLTSRFEDLVCVVGEANAWPYSERGTTKPPDELVHWTALRVATGETFSAVIAPAGPLAPSTHFHTQLSLDELRAGRSMADAATAFAHWLRPTDLIAAWGHYSPHLWLASGGTLPVADGSWLDFRAAAQARMHKRFGALETFARSLPVAHPAPTIPGRAGMRAQALAEVAQWLRQVGDVSTRVLAASFTSAASPSGAPAG